MMENAGRIQAVADGRVSVPENGGSTVEAIEGLPGIEPKFTLSFFLQILVAAAALIITIPIQIMLALLVKINSSGPVFYDGPRIGLGGTIFKLRKFRTLPDRYEYQVGGRLLTDKERTRSPLAKIIVRIKMDELPQLYNVVLGEMAIVGPRPVRPALYARYRGEIPGYSARFRVRPGITGLAQIVGGYYMDPVDKQHYDTLYIKHKSFILDIKIILLTFIALILSRRIMKSRIVERFIGFELKVRARHIDPGEDIVQKVTSGPAPNGDDSGTADGGGADSSGDLKPDAL